MARYLNDFEGAYIIISHDFDFLNNITNCILDIEFQQFKKYTGNFKQYLKLKEENARNYEVQYEKQQKEIEHLNAFINRFGAGTRASMAQSRQKQLDKIEVMPPAKSLPKPNFLFKSEQLRAGVILDVINLEVGYTTSLLPPLNFRVGAGEKIIITGFNGIGKSTMIKTIIGKIPKIAGEFK
ncbi:hypothetical protein FACS189459_2610 [Bacilli bacterium]|nr:hypothetical protein FACS189459_2610 [Bacilli bacterium]GHU52229.1 hypothetical protein FACS189496_2020 [Bacilli bacterium]